MKLVYKSLIIILCITIIGVGGFLGWTYLQNKETSAEEKTNEEKLLTSAELITHMVETQPITTNLLDRGFIKIQFAIQADSPETKTRIEKLMFQAESTIIKILSQMTREKVLAEDSLVYLEQSVKDQLDNMLEGEKIVKVYVVDRVVQ